MTAVNNNFQQTFVTRGPGPYRLVVPRDDAKRIGKRIKELRDSRGLTQEELALRAGIARTMLAGYEKGYHHPSRANLVRLAKELQVPIDDLGKPWDPEGPRGRVVDNTAEVGDNPYSQSPTTTAEGPMKDQIEAVVGALGLVDEDKRAAFVTRVKRLAASMVLGIDVEDAGAMPVKQRRGAGNG